MSERLEEAIARYLKQVEAGGRPDREEFLRLHPDLADDLRAFFSNHDGMERAAAPFRNAGPLLPLPHRFGGYELLEEVARGGMGVVYKARQLRPDRIVAVKMILAGRLASASDVERFRQEAQAAGSLEHPHIVPIYEVGEVEGQHYFSMKLIEGASLDDRLAGFARAPRAAAELMATVALAVHHAHQRGFLHRDLKPGNILLDAAGRPHVTDFGLAMRVDGAGRLTTTGTLLGTAAYMAPEQATGVGERPTTSVDVYSLGAILYEMLSGSPPFRGDTPLATLRQAVDRDPEPLRKRNPAVDRDLESICLKALEKEPERRYLSAAGLARDLERWLAGEPVDARRIGTSARVVRWCRRKPMAAGLLVLVASLLVLVGLRWTERRARRDEILKTNGIIAFLEAERLRHLFLEWAATVERTSKDPELRRRAKAKDWPALHEFLGRVHATFDDPPKKKTRAELGRQEDSHFPFDAWHFTDPGGILRGRFPKSGLEGKTFGFRDYAKGALRHLDAAGVASVHVSKIYLSESSKTHKFSFSAVVRESDEPASPILGVIEASVTTDPTLGLPNIDGRFVILVAPEDPERREGPVKAALYLMIMHPEIKRAEEALSIEEPGLGRFRRAECPSDLSLPEFSEALSEKHVDPKSGGRWLAGYAPVGNTGFIVIVQTRDE